MSGSLLTIAAGLYSQLTGTGTTVNLGGVTLSGWEVPEKMPFGGDQRLTTHKLPGGGRVIDAMGRDDRDVTWTGYLRSDTVSAMSRATLIDAIRLAGKAVPLVWGGTRRSVVVSQFLCDYTNSGHLLPYSITVVVLTVGPASTTPSLLSSVTSDVSNALGLSSILPTATAALTAAQAALPVAAVLTGGSGAYLSLQGAIGTASGAVSLAGSAADTQLTTVAAAGSAAGTPFGGIGNLLEASSAADTQAAAAQAASYLGRASTNLAA